MRANAVQMALLLDASRPGRLVEADRSRVFREEPAAAAVRRRIRLTGTSCPGVLPGENAIVHLPELVLVRGARGREGCQNRIAMLIEREVVESEAHLPGVREALPNVRLGERRELGAGGTLEVGELGDGDRCVWPAVNVRLGLSSIPGRKLGHDLR